MAARTLVSRLSPFVAATRNSSLHRLRCLIAAGDGVLRRTATASVGSGGFRSFSTRPTTTSLNDPSPNWSNRPPKETILLDGCDFEHWLVVVEPPDPSLTRDEIIDSYIKTLAQVVGSEQEARMKIYSVSTKHYFAFGALISEELSYKMKTVANVRWVLPDSYLDVKNKDYGGEPFINGEAVPYDPKYHEEWVRNNQRANERSRRNDRPRNFDRSRNFERRREAMQNRDVQPMQNQSFQSGPSQPPPQSAAPPPPAPNQYGHMPNSNVPPPTQPPPNVGYQTQMPNPGYQAGNSNVPPPTRPPPNVGYQTQMHNPGYQAGNQAHQGPGGGPSAYPGNEYQGGNQGYQGGNPTYNEGNPGYQSGGPGYHGGPPPYQSGNSHQAGSSSGYQQAYNGGNTTGYQPPAYQAGTQTVYQPPAYQGGNQTNYPPGNPPYQARDVPGRD